MTKESAVVPLPSLFEALDELVPDVLQKCELPSDWTGGECHIVELWVEHNEDDTVSITAKIVKNLESLETDWTITTPQFVADGILEKRLTKVEAEALMYFNGERTQTELDFDGPGEGDPEAEEEEKEAVPA